MGDGDTLLNAVVGGIVSLVLSFVPLSPVLGGAVAGYLQGGERRDGLWVGVYAGLVAAVPLALGGGALLLGWGAALVGIGPRAGLSLLLVVAFALLALLVGGVYTVGLSAAGGWLGHYVRFETELLD